jgi:hypothetical protein
MPIDHEAVHRVWAERILREDPLPPIEERLCWMGVLPVVDLYGDGYYDVDPALEAVYHQASWFAQALLQGHRDRVVRRREAARARRMRWVSVRPRPW